MLRTPAPPFFETECLRFGFDCRNLQVLRTLARYRFPKDDDLPDRKEKSAAFFWTYAFAFDSGYAAVAYPYRHRLFSCSANFVDAVCDAPDGYGLFDHLRLKSSFLRPILHQPAEVPCLRLARSHRY